MENKKIDENGNPQWEGSGSKPDNIIDWQGRKYDGTHPLEEYFSGGFNMERFVFPLELGKAPDM